MKRTIFILFLALTAMNLRAQTNMSLSGEGVTLKEGEKLYLYAGERTPSDSAFVKGGKFRFALKGIKPRECSLMRADDPQYANMLLYLDNCPSYVKIGAGTYKSFNNTFMEAEVAGNPTHLEVQEVNDMIFKNTDNSKNPMDSPEFIAKLKEACGRADMAAAYVLSKYASVASHAGIISEVKACYDRMPEAVKASIPGKDLGEQIQKYLNVSVGYEAKDFTLSMPEGKVVSLKEYVKGKKIVLLDFWASWCAPCRKEGENVKSIYADFKDKGFDVLGISLDTDKAKWQKAIEEEGYEWAQVSDLLGFKSPICKQYDINGIPALFLLDGNGKIIATGLRGDDMRKKVAEYCK